MQVQKCECGAKLVIMKCGEIWLVKCNNCKRFATGDTREDALDEWKEREEK